MAHPIRHNCAYQEEIVQNFYNCPKLFMEKGARSYIRMQHIRLLSVEGLVQAGSALNIVADTCMEVDHIKLVTCDELLLSRGLRIGYIVLHDKTLE